MPSLKDVKNKITAVKKTKQTTKAMNMVATSRLKGAQENMERFRLYAEKFAEVLGSLAEKAGDEGRPVRIVAPLLTKSKAEIINLGSELGVPFELTWTCYAGGERACGKCEACILRLKGFEEAGHDDPIEYED